MFADLSTSSLITAISVEMTTIIEISMIKITKNTGGFTLIELLVSIAIFSLMTTFLIVNYRVDEQARILKNQSQEVVSALEKIQNMALTGETVNSVSPSIYRFSINNCLISCFYKLSGISADDAELPVIQKALASVSVQTNQPGGLAINFYPPRGNMLIQPGDLDSAGFELSNGSASYCIKVNAVSGRIDSLFGHCP